MPESQRYNETVMDHFMNPRNVGEIKDADGIGLAKSSDHGDTMKLFIKVNNDVIVDAKFKTFGCGAAIASSSITTEMVKGKTIKEALELSNMDVIDALGGLPPSKIQCSVLAEEVLRAAIEDYRKRKTGNEETGVSVGCSGDCGRCKTK
ncbi:MAG: Fe-S cluster assembly scaffold protein NifU [Candidatus Eremiobacteraeota bacterium]|nr:Fe-S cluster assembly scaffold protein NifU [Candidatus Eremiobacteraeota bacterium]